MSTGLTITITQARLEFFSNKHIHRITLQL